MDGDKYKRILLRMRKEETTITKKISGIFLCVYVCMCCVCMCYACLCDVSLHVYE